MIQYPTNVTPQNRSIDATGVNHIIYTFNGDYLMAAYYKVINYDTGEAEFTSLQMNNDSSPIGYNGYRISSANLTGLSNKRRYITQMMLMQGNASGTPICDMPVLGGTVQATNSFTVFYIESGIESIYPWGKSGSSYTPMTVNDTILNPMVIKIGNQTRTILSYDDNITVGDKVYGRITIDTAAAISVGDRFQIYTNAIITPQYFFRCEALPTLSISHREYRDRMFVGVTYTQTNLVPIKYFILRLMWSNNQGFVTSEETGEYTKLVEETNKLYSQNINYYFETPYQHDENYQYGTTDYYRIQCELVTQYDETITLNTQSFAIVPNDYSEDIGNRLFDYKLWWDSETGRVIHALRGYGSSGMGHSGRYELFRKDLDNGEEIQLEPHHYTMSDEMLLGYDLTASTKGNYQYTLKRFDDDGGVMIPVVMPSYEGIGTFPSEIIHTNETAYYITNLIPTQDQSDIYHPNESASKKYMFNIGDTWKFMCDIQNTTVTNNLDTVTHVGYSKYTASTSTDVNYMSGTLSGFFGRMNCAEKKFEDNIALVRAWREFITQKGVFLLKSQKGDVWVVNITDNPTTDYDESYHTIPTTFSFSWAEAYDVHDLLLYDR